MYSQSFSTPAPSKLRTGIRVKLLEISKFDDLFNRLFNSDHDQLEFILSRLAEWYKTELGEWFLENQLELYDEYYVRADTFESVRVFYTLVDQKRFEEYKQIQAISIIQS